MKPPKWFWVAVSLILLFFALSIFNGQSLVDEKTASNWARNHYPTSWIAHGGTAFGVTTTDSLMQENFTGRIAKWTDGGASSWCFEISETADSKFFRMKQECWEITIGITGKIKNNGYPMVGPETGLQFH
jgi:hypothetical protein